MSNQIKYSIPTLNNINANLTYVIAQNNTNTRDIPDLKSTSTVQGDCLKMLDRQFKQSVTDYRQLSAYVKNNVHPTNSQGVTPSNLNLIVSTTNSKNV